MIFEFSPSSKGVISLAELPSMEWYWVLLNMNICSFFPLFLVYI